MLNVLPITKDHNFKQIEKVDKHTFEILFRKYYSSLCNYASSFRLSMEDCEEQVQQLFYKIWQNKDSLKIDSSIEAYLYSALRNSILNKIKHEKIKLQYIEHQNTNGSLYETYDPAVTTELEDLIAETVDKLPTERKKIFLMSRNEGLKYREIAEKLNISIKTVENQMGKALSFMREALQEYMPLILIVLVLQSIDKF